MRSNTNILLLGLGAFLVYRFFKNDAEGARLFSSVRLQMRDISIQGDDIVIRFNIQNPTSEKILFRSLVGDVYLSGEKVGNAESFMQKWIPIGNSEIVVNVQMKIYNIATKIAQMIQYRQRPVLEFNGTININDQLIPLSTTYALA